MLNKNGKSIFLVILITMAVTLLFCYVVVKITLYSVILKNGIEYSTDDFSKLEKVKSIIDSSYLNDYKEEELIDSTISGMLKGLNDPYAAYTEELKGIWDTQEQSEKTKSLQAVWRNRAITDTYDVVNRKSF